MSTPVLTQLKKEVLRHASTYAAARARCPELAPYETVESLLQALHRASPLDRDARHALVALLVREAQRTRGPLWQSVLLLAFEPMLERVRSHLGLCRGDTYADVDQRVLAAFLGAVAAVRPGPFTPTALRWATMKEVFGAVRADRRLDEEVFEENAHSGKPWQHDAREAARAAADEVLRVLESRGDDELVEVVLATSVGDDTLREYVERRYAGRGPGTCAASYERLCRARNRVVDEIREHFEARAA